MIYFTFLSADGKRWVCLGIELKRLQHTLSLAVGAINEDEGMHAAHARLAAAQAQRRVQRAPPQRAQLRPVTRRHSNHHRERERKQPHPTASQDTLRRLLGNI